MKLQMVTLLSFFALHLVLSLSAVAQQIAVVATSTKWQNGIPLGANIMYDLDIHHILWTYGNGEWVNHLGDPQVKLGCSELADGSLGGVCAGTYFNAGSLIGFLQTEDGRRTAFPLVDHMPISSGTVNGTIHFVMADRKGAYFDNDGIMTATLKFAGCLITNDNSTATSKEIYCNYSCTRQKSARVARRTRLFRVCR